jgi:hypothetical protein
VVDSPDYDAQPRPVYVKGAISSHDLAIRDLIGWNHTAMTHEAQVLLDERKQYGLSKYVDEHGRGVVLHKDNGRDHAKDALDEALDLSVYLRTWMDQQPELSEFIRPLYLMTLTTLVSLANWQANQNQPAMHRPVPGSERHIWPSMPERHPAHVSFDELSALDNGIVMYWPVAPGEQEEGIVCGGLQRDEQRCIRPLTEVMGSLECPRHGVRRRS